MHPQVIQAIRVFMQRVDLKGSEVAAFNAVMNELNDLEKAAADALAAQQTPAGPPKLKVVPDNSPVPDVAAPTT